MWKTKKILFKSIVEQFPELGEIDETALDRLVFTRKNNIRLTYKGCLLMRKMFDHYAITLDRDQIKTRHLITLTRKFTYPYYFGRHQVILFNDEDATMMRMYGDPAIFLTSIE